MKNIREEKKLKSISETKNFSDQVENNLLEKEISRCIGKVRNNLNKYGDKFPAVFAEKDGHYKLTNNEDWTTGFWTGITWLCYEFTSDEFFKEHALKQVMSFKERMNDERDLNFHDIGCLYAPSCVAAYKICGDEIAKDTAIQAAYRLCKRFTDRGNFIQAWGDLLDPTEYRLIIDGYICLPLLYWAHSVTGNERFKYVADSHAKAALLTIRDDYSTFHVYFFDVESGHPLEGKTHQGYSDESVWARGQSWAVWGMALQYLYTNDKVYFDNFVPVTKYFLNNLPNDNVPYWDFIFKDGDNAYRDASAAAISACGILAIYDLLPNNADKEYINRGLHAMMYSLITKYQTNGSQEGLLDKSTYHGTGKGMDVACLFGDYYYLEALMRMKNPSWTLYG